MVRFKVVRGSHLLLAVSAVLLVAVVIMILLQATSPKSETAGNNAAEAKAISAFASSSSVDAGFKIEVMKDKQNQPPLADAPRILIYHTHTHEAYEQDSESEYEALEAWRTDDEQYSIVRIGAALADELSMLGNFVMHDTTDHELDDIDLAYMRALETLESYSVEFDLIIDLHRDAYNPGLKKSLVIGENSYAQIMLLVGNGGNYVNEEAPVYEKNFQFAQHLTSRLNQSVNGIARNVTIKNGRYNQHIGKTAALIEVGHNRNTLAEALNSVPILAKSIDGILKQIS